MKLSLSIGTELQLGPAGTFPFQFLFIRLLSAISNSRYFELFFDSTKSSVETVGSPVHTRAKAVGHVTMNPPKVLHSLSACIALLQWLVKMREEWGKKRPR